MRSLGDDSVATVSARGSPLFCRTCPLRTTIEEVLTGESHGYQQLLK